MLQDRPTGNETSRGREREREREKQRGIVHVSLVAYSAYSNLAASENDEYFPNGLSVKYTSPAVYVHSSYGYYCNHVSEEVPGSLRS